MESYFPNDLFARLHTVLDLVLIFCTIIFVVRKLVIMLESFFPVKSQMCTGLMQQNYM